MAGSGKFLVTGLSDLQRTLIKAEKAEPKLIKQSLLTITDVYVDKARPRLRSQIHDPRSKGSLEATLKGRATVRSASVVLGTPVRVAYGGWWEFGGPLEKSRRPPNREYIKKGRVLYPTLTESREEIQASTELVISQLVALFDT